MNYMVTEIAVAEWKRRWQEQRTPRGYGVNQMKIKHTSMSSRMGLGRKVEGNSVYQCFPLLIKI